MLEEYGCYSRYLAVTKAQELKEKTETDEIKMLELQKLRTENLLLTDQLVDLPKVKNQRNIIFAVALVELLLILLGLLFKK